MAGYAPPGALPLIDRSIREATAEGVMMQTADDAVYAGRYVDLGGHRLRNFGGCSYLGLEQREELKEAAIAAVRRYGTQFSFSRAYLQSPLYQRLEQALDAMTGGHTLVAASTTLAHVAALPVLVHPDDAVIVDQFTHASVQTAASLLGDTPVVLSRHNDVAALEARIEELEARHARVWFVLDGLYSMLGDYAPMSAIGELLTRHSKLHLYIDDAHSTSWRGLHGRGHALDVLPMSERVVVALSLNKAFSAAGGALVLASAELRALVRHCGGPMLFSGPVQPPMLGAAVASAELHLAPDFGSLQRSLLDRIDRVIEVAGETGVRFAADERTPIFFVRCGPLKAMYPLARALREKGFYTVPSGFPAVPKNQAGIRFTVSLHNTFQDIDDLVSTLAFEMKRLGVGGSHQLKLGDHTSFTPARRTSAPPPPRASSAPPSNGARPKTSAPPRSAR